MSDLTTRRVIMIVLAIMFSLPIFGISTYTVNLTSSESGLYYLYEYLYYLKIIYSFYKIIKDGIHKIMQMILMFLKMF